jgi:HK97 family phage prohead protease
MEKKVRKLLTSEILKGDSSLAEKRQIRVTAASGKGDRQGDIVKVDGIDLSNYKKNSVVLYGHDHYGLPIAKAVDMGIVNGKLEMTFEFADAETYAFADTVYRLVKGGFLKGVSIGARVIEADWIRDDDERIIGRKYNKLELLEVSVVAIPADSKALITAVKSGAVTEAEFEEYMSKSFEATLDMPTENQVQVNTVGSSPEEDEDAMKEEIAALTKRIEALETLLKAQSAASETAAKSMESIQGMFTTLQTQMQTKSAPNVSEIAAAANQIPGPAGDIAKQVFSMLEAMTKKVK